MNCVADWIFSNKLEFGPVHNDDSKMIVSFTQTGLKKKI